MTYVVMELQTNGETTAVVPPVSYSNKQQAEAAYHTILSAAAVSQVEKHAAVIVADNGQIVRSECYYHPTESEEET